MTLSKFDKYEIGAEIGRGGFGIVYKARDTTLNRAVAIKALKPAMVQDPAFMARFQHEAQAVANLKHPNIVTIYELGENQGAQYIVMEFLEGASLDKVLATDAPLPLDRAADILAQIASALDYAHGKGLIHRDVKPSNIIIAPDGHATITDFGLVKDTLGSTAMTSGQIIGTPEYMTPEQVQDEPVDARTDVYALGIVLFEMLTGQVPFKAKTAYATLYKQVNEPPPSIRSLRGDLPPAIEDVMNNALAKQPDARYQTTGALSEAVQRAIHDATMCARAPAQAQVQVRRNSVEQITLLRTWAIAGSILALLVSLLGLGLILNVAISLKPNEMVMATNSAPMRTSGLMTATPSSRLIGLTDCMSGLSATKQEYWDKVPIDVKSNALGSQDCKPIEKYIDGLMTAKPTLAPQVTPTVRIIVATATPSPTPTPTETPRVTPTLRAGEERVIGDAPMVYVPAGDFTMGSDDDTDNEKPAHTVYLDAFWIDKFLVTNAFYKRCVDASKCSAPATYKGASKGVNTRDPYYGNPSFDNYPVIYVSWDDATKFCAWAGKRLPTEAQWEKAARGTDGRTYPWGNTWDGQRLNSWDSSPRRDDTTAVGSYPSGASPYGALDMAGNVLEWVADWYDGNYYSSSPRNNPKGPSSGQWHIVRGGAWGYGQDFARAAARVMASPVATSMGVGFRCARSP